MVTAEHEYLTPTQAALRLGVSTQTMKDWTKAGKLVEVIHTPLGRLFAVAEVERVAAERSARKGAAKVAAE